MADRPKPKGKGRPKGGKQIGGKKKLTRKRTEPLDKRTEPRDDITREQLKSYWDKRGHI